MVQELNMMSAIWSELPSELVRGVVKMSRSIEDICASEESVDCLTAIEDVRTLKDWIFDKLIGMEWNTRDFRTYYYNSMIPGEIYTMMLETIGKHVSIKNFIDSILSDTDLYEHTAYSNFYQSFYQTLREDEYDAEERVQIEELKDILHIEEDRLIESVSLARTIGDVPDYAILWMLTKGRHFKQHASKIIKVVLGSDGLDRSLLIKWARMLHSPQRIEDFYDWSFTYMDNDFNSPVLPHIRNYADL